MGGQNRIIVIMLGVLAALVLVIGGLSAVLLLGGGEDGEEEPAAAAGTTTDTGGQRSDGGGDDSAGDGGDGDGDSAAASGRLRLPGNDPVTLDPHIAGDSGSAEYIVEVFNGLVTISPDLNIELDLAEALEISEDGLQYTFTLRDDILFHNGRRVTAEDVRWSIERAASPELASPTALAYLGDIIGVREHFYGLAETIEGIEVVDDRTIRFTIDEPKPYFLAKLSYPTAFVVDQQQIEGNPRGWTRRPIGTGPYRLQEWRIGERIVLRANPRFHFGEPAVREVLYELAGGSTLTRFENGELDIAFISVNDIDRARDPSSDIGPLYQEFSQFTISYLAFNTEVPPFDDVNVRRALGLSIDRSLIAEVTFKNMLAPATGILMPQLPGYTPDDKTLQFDPELARQLLAESKYGSAENLPPIVITEVGGGAEARIDTQAFIEQWRNELGIEVRIQQTDFATFLEDQDSGRLQMFNAGWIMDYPDPEDILDLKFHSESELNDVGYANAEVDEILNRARTEQDTATRLALYQQAERLIIDDAAWLPLYFSRVHVVINADVEGWFEPPMVIPRLRHVTVNR
ncbi:MAG: peptide ABC transporter substrate-binding protein [Chloroflexi bacterium]|nr:peptide ABC transporter substrate-binding protein [Chloroflexota bacterium]MYE47172.1 peptide ABC transporter substrate-binding protein [Chloroflexota bacterium]